MLKTTRKRGFWGVLFAKSMKNQENSLGRTIIVSANTNNMNKVQVKTLYLRQLLGQFTFYAAKSSVLEI